MDQKFADCFVDVDEVVTSRGKRRTPPDQFRTQVSAPYSQHIHDRVNRDACCPSGQQDHFATRNVVTGGSHRTTLDHGKHSIVLQSFDCLALLFVAPPVRWKYLKALSSSDVAFAKLITSKALLEFVEERRLLDLVKKRFEFFGFSVGLKE